MGDFSEVYESINQEKRDRHAQWKIKNMEELSKSGLNYRLAGEETVLFRDPGKPKVDFYPSTGRWRIPGQKKTFRGGAISFISWYKKSNLKLPLDN